MIKHPFKLAFHASLPVFFCYLPLGMVYGLLFTESGAAWYFAPLFSFFVLAGAMQFLALSVAGTDTSLLALSLSLIPLGIRNIFYGFSMKKRYQNAHPLLRYYLAHGLVDATYSILMMQPKLEEKEDLRYITTLTLIIHAYWVIGTVFGAFFAGYFPLPKGLEFSLAAFFAATLVEHYLKTKDYTSGYISLVSLLGAFLIFPKHFFLTAVAFSFVLCLILPRKKEYA